jgi:hypothetical protein
MNSTVILGEFFEDWLRKWDRKLGQQKRKILLLIDNCPAHPKIKLSNITLQFFLPNATAEVQVSIQQLQISNSHVSQWIRALFRI